MFLSPHGCVWAGAKHRKINWKNGGWRHNRARAFIRINESEHSAESIGQLSVYTSQITVWIQLQVNSSVNFINGFPHWRTKPYKFLFITSFSRPGPHHVEWSLHSRENRHPVDSAQWSLLLCRPVSRWWNILSTFIDSSGYVLFVPSSESHT